MAWTRPGVWAAAMRGLGLRRGSVLLGTASKGCWRTALAPRNFPALPRECLAGLSHASLDGVGPVPAELLQLELRVNRRPRKLELNGFGERAFWVEEDVGHVDRTALPDAGADHAGPFARRAHQAGRSRVSDGVGHFFDHVVVGDEQHDAGLVGGPEVFPATERGILRFGEQAMEVREELRQARARVGDDTVPVVGHEADGVQ